jgi:hypothetical protein
MSLTEGKIMFCDYTALGRLQLEEVQELYTVVTADVRSVFVSAVKHLRKHSVFCFWNIFF